MSHTPGPWIAHPDSDYVYALDEDGERNRVSVSVHALTREEQAANTLLIAQAPTMLRDLTLALEWIENLLDTKGFDERTVLDRMPNNWRGRIDMRETIANAGGS